MTISHRYGVAKKAGLNHPTVHQIEPTQPSCIGQCAWDLCGQGILNGAKLGAAIGQVETAGMAQLMRLGDFHRWHRVGVRGRSRCGVKEPREQSHHGTVHG